MRPLALALVLAAASSGAAAQDAASPELTRLSADGLRAELEARRGQIVVLNMWATWCGPCVEEFPHLVAFGHEATPEAVTVMAISSDYDQDLESQVHPFLREQQPPFPVFLQQENDTVFYPAVDPEWRGSYPHTVIYNAQGEIAARLGQFHSPAELHAAVAAARLPEGR
ncbi:MAG: TlpA family protein disulfide reductase [Candidatus Sumerlaeia bacterium]|nr:TlpA family protein disulfide reductase [Candidatus Sumerlaeia bacterium]